MNTVKLWDYPTLNKVAELEGHQARILSMAMSPDGTRVVSAGGDETLRFWKLWEKKEDKKKLKQSPQKLNTNVLR